MVVNDSDLVNPTSGDDSRVIGHRDTGGADWLLRSCIGETVASPWSLTAVRGQ